MFRILKINLILFTIISCISCSQIVKNENDEKQISDVSESSSKSYLRISIDDATARTILPKTVNFEDFDTLILKGMHNSLSEQLGTWSSYLELQNATIEIDSGLWEFELIAKKNTLVYSAKINKQVQNGENTAHFSLSLANLGEGTGSFEIILSYGDAPNAHDVKLVKFSLQNIDGTELSDYDSELFPNNNTVSYFADNISTGNYRICLTFYGDTKKNLKLADYSEIVLVASGIESTASRELNSLNEIYHLTYNLNDDEENPAFLNEAQETYTRYSSFELSIPTRAGYNFAGWWTNKDFEEEVDRIDYTKDNEVYALWVKGIPVKASNITDVVSNLKESCELNVVGTISNEDLKSIGIALNNLEEDILVDIDLSLAKSLTSIGDYAFGDCSKLKNIVFPTNLTEITDSAFQGCKNLMTLIIPEGVISIDNSAFKNCFNLSEIKFPEKLQKIGENAFSGCNSLEELLLPNNVREIGNSAFNGCSNLKIVRTFGDFELENTFSESIDTNTENYVFSDCTLLESCVLPNGIKRIGSQMFRNCKFLEYLKIPDNVKMIADYIFYKCNSPIDKIVLPKSLGYVSDYAFDGIEFNNVYYNGTLESWCKINFGYRGHPGGNLYISDKLLTEVVIPDGIEKINAYAFKGCSSITSVIIPDTVESVGLDAFAQCGNLKCVQIGTKLKSWDSSVSDCNSLEKINYTRTIDSWCDIDFSGASRHPCYRGAKLYINDVLLENVFIPATVISIKPYVFYNTKITKLEFEDKANWYYTDNKTYWLYKRNGTNIEASILSDTSLNAKRFKSTFADSPNFYDKYLYKGE